MPLTSQDRERNDANDNQVDQDNQVHRDPIRLLESVRDRLWAEMYKTLAEPTSREGQQKYWDYERAKDIMMALIDFHNAEKDLAWLVCDASYYRINLMVTDEDIEKISRGLGRSFSLKRVELE